MYKLKLIILLQIMLLNGCGGGSSNQSDIANELYRVAVSVPDLNKFLSIGGTFFSVKNSSGKTVAAAGLPRIWNTYCQNSLNQLQFFLANQHSDISIEKINKPDINFKTGYGVTTQDGIFAWDMANNQSYKLKEGADGIYSQSFAAFPCKIDEFKFGNFTFNYEYSELENTKVLACNSKNGNCAIAEIARGTIVYTYASHGNSVIAISNWGDILKFTEKDGWTRAVKAGLKYTFPLSYLAPPLSNPSGVQFYSSINFNDKTLLGEYPNGAIYEYNGSEIIPWINDREKITRPYRSEAQSMSVYCGDLYVGYWPRGELWRLSDGVWSRIKRLFSHPIEKEPFEPYSDLPNNPIVSNFYGQRITALSNYGESMYAFTSNKSSWVSNIDFSSAMSVSNADEYGAIHKITKDSCITGWLPHVSAKRIINFEINKEKITIKVDGSEIASTKNLSGFIPSINDQLIIGEGIFGDGDKNLFELQLLKF